MGFFGQTQPQPATTNTFGQPQSTFGGFGTQTQTQPAGGLLSGETANTVTGTSASGGLGAQTNQTSFGFESNTATNTGHGRRPLRGQTFQYVRPTRKQLRPKPTINGASFRKLRNGNQHRRRISLRRNLQQINGTNLRSQHRSTFDRGLNFGTGSLFGNTANTSTLGSGTNTFVVLGTSTFGGIGTNTVLGGQPGQPAQPAVSIHQ